MSPLDRLHTSSYSSSIVTKAASRTVFEIKLDGRKRQFFISSCFTLHDPLEPLVIFRKILIQSVRVPGLFGAKILAKSSTLCVACTNVTDRQQTTDGRLIP